MKRITKLTLIKKRRIDMKLTQQFVGSQLGVATSSVGGFERGDNPISSEIAEKLSKLLLWPKDKLFSPHPKLAKRYIAK